MTTADITRIIPIEKASFPRPWNSKSYFRELFSKTSNCFTVKKNNHATENDIIAYICFRLFETRMHLLKIAVSPEWRRSGIAEWLIGKSIQTAEKKGADSAFLEVRPSNRKALAMYNKLGFNIIGKEPNYYAEDREDALIMYFKFKEEQNEH